MAFDFSPLKSIARGEPVKKKAQDCLDIKVFDEGEPQTTEEQQQQPAPEEEQERQAEAEYESAGLELDIDKELKAGVIEFLSKQTAQAQPDIQSQTHDKGKPYVYTYEEVTANYNRAHEELKRRLVVNPNTSLYSPFFIDGVTDKVAGYKWTAELLNLREHQARPPDSL